METVFKPNLFFTCLAVLLCLGITALSYGQAMVFIDPAQVNSPDVGGQINLSIKISNSRGVAGYKVTVGFDATALQYVEIKNGNYLPAGVVVMPAQVSGDRVTLAATASSEAVAESDTLATLKFKVVAAKPSTLRLIEVILLDSATNVLSVQTRNAEVIVGQSPAWDLNRDGQVNELDLMLVALNFGKIGLLLADVNGDRAVNVLDLVLVAQHLDETVGITTPVVIEPGVPQTPEGMALIPAGSFQMGSDTGEVNEKPVHTVHVDAFYMDAYAVTNADYKRFIDEVPEWQKDHISEKYHDGAYLAHWEGNTYPSDQADHPVVYVSWYAAVAYSEWAGKRLPTEAEWEKAARGGLIGRKYPWGDDEDVTHATVQFWGSPPITTPVGTYRPNDYGLYDMVGNVWEWCLDAYDADFYTNSPSRNPIAGADSLDTLISGSLTVETPRVLRGGAWAGDPRIPSVAVRDTSEPGRTLSLAGFRCVRNASP